MQLVFATNNQHKLQEVKKLLRQDIELLSLKELGFQEEIPETKDTLKGNAEQKARTIAERYKVNCFADDTGLEVDALDGAPGVYSARYAGENCSYEDNVNKLLHEMNGISQRNAAFKTVICLIENGMARFFEGSIAGSITTEARGNEGFGYDPVFLPLGHKTTFAEMNLKLKNAISHRGIATRELIAYLNQLI